MDPIKYTLDYFIKAYDLFNNSATISPASGKDLFNNSATISPASLRFEISYRGPVWTEFLNKFFTDIKILDINPGNHTSLISINIEAPAVDKSQLASDILMPSSYVNMGGHVYSQDNKYGFDNEHGFFYTLKNYSHIDNWPLPDDSNITSLGMSDLKDRREAIFRAEYPVSGSMFLGEPSIGRVPLFGNVLLYPFDDYKINMSVGFPVPSGSSYKRTKSGNWEYS